LINPSGNLRARIYGRKRQRRENCFYGKLAKEA